MTGDDGLLIRAMLEQHPNKSEKLAGGCTALNVGINVGDKANGVIIPPSRGFQIARSDGTTITFSYRVALGLASTGLHITRAARNAIAPTILAYKLQRYNGTTQIPCDETGKLVAFADADVDHAKPWTFKRILAAFVDQYGEPPIVDLDVSCKFDNEEDAVLFCAFHDERAQLRIVHRDVNTNSARHTIMSILAKIPSAVKKHFRLTLSPLQEHLLCTSLERAQAQNGFEGIFCVLRRTYNPAAEKTIIELEGLPTTTENLKKINRILRGGKA